MDFSINISGVDATLATLAKLPRSTINKALKPALRKGANVVRKKATANVKALVSSEATGLGENSLRVYNMKKKNGMLRVGVMVKKGLKTKEGVRVGLYMSVLEYGKKDQPPRPYLRPATRSSAGEVLKTVKEDVAANVDKAIAEAKE